MKRSAFTLVELLVVIAIVAVLAALGYTVSSRMITQGYLAREVAAARNLTAGYLAYAAENNGELLAGYASSAPEITDDEGKPIHYPASGRYPWRLAAYLKASPKGTLIVNQQAKLTEGKAHAYYVYVVSLLPTLGLNATFIGGNHTGALAPSAANTARLGNFCITQIQQAVKPSRQIVFISAHFESTGEGAYGYHMVDPPATTGRKWSGSYVESEPSKHGYVHLRYGGKAVTAMLDGHVEMLDFDQLQDMRRWSNQAAEADNPNFVLSRQ